MIVSLAHCSSSESNIQGPGRGFGVIVRIWFPFTYISFYNIFPFLHIFTPYKFPEILQNTLKICLKLYYKYSQFLQNSLSQSEATEPSGTVASLSFNSPSKSGNTLFGMCSQHILTATSDVLGWASSPEPTEPSLFKPEPSRTLTRAC